MFDFENTPVNIIGNDREYVDEDQDILEGNEDATDDQSTEVDGQSETDLPDDNDSEGEEDIDNNEPDDTETYEITDELPEKFESLEHEKAWYKFNYESQKGYYESEDFKKEFLEEYKKVLSETEENYQKVMAIEQALNGDPEILFKLYFGADLVDKYPVLTITETEAREYAEKELRKTFGKDFMAKYNQEDLSDPESYSSSLMRTYEKIISDVKKHNQSISEKMISNKPVSEEEQKAAVEEQYNQDFKTWMKREDYDKFIEEIKDKPVDIMGLYKMFHYDEHLKQMEEKAYEKGKKEGRLGVIAELKKSNGVHKYEPKQKNVTIDKTVGNSSKNIFQV